MASTSQMRAWWSSYECDPSKMTRVSFPGVGREWGLLVADKSAPIWEAVAQIMASEPYLFREVAGGTYNCRPPSLHAYGLALDLNPSKNPFAFPLKHEYPQTFIHRMEGVTANGKPAVRWGGRFPDSNPPDAMHWQINVPPADCKNVQWDQGDDVMPTVDEIWDHTVPDQDKSGERANMDHAVKMAWHYSKRAATDAAVARRLAEESAARGSALSAAEIKAIGKEVHEAFIAELID